MEAEVIILDTDADPGILPHLVALVALSQRAPLLM